MLKKTKLFFVPHFLCVIAILFGNVHFVRAAVPRENSSYSPEGMDIVLLMDNSRTMWENHFSRQKDDPLSLRNDAMRAAVNIIVGSDARIGFVYFADHVYKRYSLQYVTSEKQYHDVCGKYLDVTDAYPTNINTNVSEGLAGAMKLFDKDSARRKVIVLFSDGVDDDASEAVSQLLKKDIELHCISVNSDSDEQLRRLVNYQKDTHLYDNRFTSVNPDNLGELYDKFAEKFFGLRGDVRYEKIELDSDGSYSFSIPELAVDKFQLYIRGNGISARLSGGTDPSMQEIGADKWREFDHCSFTTVWNPGKSEYFLKVSAENPGNLSDATVMLAYYTRLRADVSIEPVEQAEVLRGHDARLKIWFFDGNDRVIKIDSNAVVTARAEIKNSGSSAPKVIPVSEKDGDFCISEPFSLDDFGEISVCVDVSFGENIHIGYCFDTGVRIAPHPPSTIKKYSSNTITAEKIQRDSRSKFLFSIPLEEYISDIDSSLEEMKVSDKHSYSNNNHFTAYTESGRLIIEADNDGVINGFVELEDESGLKTKLDIEGNIKKMGDKNSLWLVVLLLAGLGIAIFLWYRMRQNSNKSEIVTAVEKGLDGITSDRKRQKIAFAVEPVFEKIVYAEIKAEVIENFNERISETDGQESQKDQIAVSAVKSVLHSKKGLEIRRIVKEILAQHDPAEQNIVNIIEEIFSEFILEGNKSEITGEVFRNDKIKSDDGFGVSGYKETEYTDEVSVPYSIRVRNKATKMSYGLMESLSGSRSLGDFETMSGCKVRDLPDNIRPDTSISFCAGRENGEFVVYVKRNGETETLCYGQTLDWPDMEITLN